MQDFLQMIDQQAITLGTAVVSAGATVATLMYGIGQYRQQEINRILSQLRQDCSLVDQLANQLDDDINDASFTALGQAIVRNLDTLVPDAKNATDYFDRFEKMDHDLITSAMITVTYELHFLGVAENNRTMLREVTGKQVEYFPAIKRILQASAYFITSTHAELMSSYLHRRVFSGDGWYDPKKFWGTTREKFAGRADNLEQARLAFARSFALLSRYYYDTEKDQAFKAALAIIDAVTMRVDKASSRDLAAMMKMSDRMERRTDRIIAKTKTYSDEIESLARLIRAFLGKQAYEEVLKNCKVIKSLENGDGGS